ncbi:MAG: pre-tRNA nuclear export protein [Peltula sp. TS41687]|nr:MAG: pre-tRNA nuclear export protein [Peltula sp. TS41687]
MEAKIESAIEIAWNPTADQSLKRQAFNFLNDLRSEPTVWQMCACLFMRVPRASDIVRHTALELINNAVQSQQLDGQNLITLRDGLVNMHIRQIYGRHEPQIGIDSPSIQNKLAQTITYLFEVLYENEWASFFADFYGLAHQGFSQPPTEFNIAALMLYLRILSSIHDQIADVLVPRTPEQQKSSTQLKDLIRQRDAQKVAHSWQEVLSPRWQAGREEVIDLCLKVVSHWVSWTDISLVVNEALLTPLYQLVVNGDTLAGNSDDKVRTSAIGTVTEIVAKKMKPRDKIELIGFLNLGNMIDQLISSAPLWKMQATSGYDTEMAEAVAKLVNTAACDIIRSLGVEPDGTARTRADELLQLFIPWVLRFFSDEYDEVSSAVIPSLNDLVAMFRRDLKTKGSLDAQHQSMLSPILNAVILKMKYDETTSWANEDEQSDEAEFQDLRKRLQVLQQAVAAVDETLYFEVINNVVNNTFEKVAQQGSQVDWRDLDLALYEMYLFGELAVKSGGLYSKGQPTNPAAGILTRMLANMIQSGIAAFPHPSIQLQYMEICVRYHAFFENNPNMIPDVLENFVRFVHHDHVRVKTRSWYLFQRFVKQLRSHLGNVSQTVIQAIGDLLEIKAEPTGQDSGNDSLSMDPGQNSAENIFNSQLYLFEAIGCIASVSSVPVEKQAMIAQSVSAPLYSDLEKYLSSAKAGDEQATLQIQHTIMALGTLARGFSDGTPGVSPSASAKAAGAVSDEFERSAEAIVVSLESLNTSYGIRTAARFAFSRLLAVLGARILPQLPRWIQGLLSANSTKDEITTFLRLLEQVIYGFKSEMYSMLEALLTPLLHRVFAELAQPTTGTDDAIQLSELKREFLNLILVIMNNKLGSVLVSNGNTPDKAYRCREKKELTRHLVNQSNFESLLSVIELFAKDISDLSTAKPAFTVLIGMCSEWGGPDVVPMSGSTQPAAAAATTNGTTDHSALPGFSRFMIERFSADCWGLPTNPAFNPRDAQARQVIAEIASLQKTIYCKTGDEFLAYLRDIWFPSLALENSVAEQYVSALQTRDLKGFRQFFLGGLGHVALFLCIAMDGAVERAG